jgi:hypothetical protein
VKRKVLLTGLPVLCLVFSLTLIGCGNDDDHNPFSNTRWSIEKNFGRTFTLEFIDGNQWSANELSNAAQVIYSSGTYTHDGNVAILVIKDKGQSNLEAEHTMTARINDNDTLLVSSSPQEQFLSGTYTHYSEL